MILAALPLFFGAFLLFMVQPLLAQRLLPWFGGGASVWITCLVFFQGLLLMGYAYADLLNHIGRRARYLHIVVLCGVAIAVFFYPLLPTDALKPTPNTNPMLGILRVLSISIALPFFLLSTTSSLVQSWLVQRMLKRQVHRLFALSNAGSLLALLSYPFFIEPFTTLHQRAQAWKVGFSLYWVLMLLFTLKGSRSALVEHDIALEPQLIGQLPPNRRDFMKWMTYAALSSLLLSASTYHLTQDIAPMPLLWLLPLSLYLLTFIIAFNRPDWYKPLQWDGPLVFVLALLMFLLHNNIGIETLIPAYAGAVFVMCYVYHGELAQSRPIARYLSRFYFAIAFGGALGAALAGLVVPITIGQDQLLAGCIIATGLVMTFRYFCAFKVPSASLEIGPDRVKALSAMTVLVLITIAVCAYHGYKLQEEKAKAVWSLRFHNFYGSLKLEHIHEPKEPVINRLSNGTTLHGFQVYQKNWEQQPVAYFHRLSGVGVALSSFHPQGRRLGVVGLGVGTMAAYVGAGESIRFYDINPIVKDIAWNYFTYLKGAQQRGARVDVVVGDARLALEREVQKGGEVPFDVLVLDAFNSDAIPSHLLTREALHIYLKRLKSNGLLAVHISHRFIDLAPVIARLAEEAGWTALSVNVVLPQRVLKREYGLSSEWILVSANPAIIQKAPWVPKAKRILPVFDVPLWTDEQISFRCLWKAYPCRRRVAML